MKKIKFLLIIAIITGFVLMDACKESFLDITPKGSLDESVLATYEGVDGLIIGAYSMVDGVCEGFGWEAASSGWVYGSIRGMEANKGTDAGDQPDINPLQTYSETSTNPYLNIKWRSTYEGISRCNSTIVTAITAEEAGTISADDATSFIRQARAIRGYYHFLAWKLWADRSTNLYVPYVDENTDQSTLTNEEDIRDKIIEDLTEGTLLPNNMVQVGRFNKTVCQVLLAKAQMQMFGDYTAALALLTAVETSGTNPANQSCSLAPLYGDIFDAEFRNSTESVYTVQYSVNDNSGGWNAGRGEVLNFPYKGGSSPGGCCGFFNPTQDFVNSFRTSGGLPLLDGSYNNPAEEILRDQGIPAGGVWKNDDEYLIGKVVTMYDPTEPFLDRAYKSLTGTAPPDDPDAPNIGNNPLTSPANWEFLWVEDNSKEVDPRLDWAAGRRGIPYWDWGDHTGADWIRDQTYSGPYSPKKQVYKQSQEGTLTEVGNWTSGYTANGYRTIRYSDALLLKAECEAKTGSGDRGMGEVNAIRTRAADPAGFVKEADGTTNAANYVIGIYPASQFADEASAMTAIKFERKLELGQEGHRYYDLQRWGDVVSELTRILAYEKTMEWGNLLYGDASIGPEDVNFPVPQRQIDVSNGKLIQNIGH
jgi:hypothetical protein